MDLGPAGLRGVVAGDGGEVAFLCSERASHVTSSAGVID
jgi:hypothetical protein